MSAYINAPGLPVTIEVLDATVEEARQAVEEWTSDNAVTWLHMGDTGVMRVLFRDLPIVLIGDGTPRSEGDESKDAEELKPVYSIRLHDQ